MAKPKMGTSITLGGHTSFHLDNDGELYLAYDISSNDPTYIHLGKGTKQRFIDLQHYLDRLSIHAIDA